MINKNNIFEDYYFERKWNNSNSFLALLVK